MKTETIILITVIAAAAVFVSGQVVAAQPVQPPVKPVPFSDQWFLSLFNRG